MKRYSIQNKIVIPFTLLFVAVILVSTFVTIALFNRKYDEQNTKDTERWHEVIFQTNYYREIEKIKKAFGVEVTIFSVDNGVTTTTLKDVQSEQIAKAVKIHEARELMKSGRKLVMKDISFRGKPFKVVHYAQEYGRMYTMMRPMSEIAAAKRQIKWMMILIAAVGILLVAFIAHMIAKNITAPVKYLVEITKKVAAGDLEQEGKVMTHDEIGELTIAFNQMTRDVRKSRQELVEAERLAMAGKMAAAFAHDIRNPLSSIKMMVQLLRKRVQPGEENQKYIRAIIDEIDRLDVIVTSMKDFARPQKLNLQTGDVNAALLEVLGFMEANLSHHNITLVKKLSVLPVAKGNESALQIQFDVDKLKSVFMNIVLNAMQAMPNGGSLEIVTKRHLKAVKIEISDTGIGIPKENFPQLFEPFFTTKAEGTGLGLTNAKRILQQHGGTIEVESEENVGTKVIMTLQQQI